MIQLENLKKHILEFLKKHPKSKFKLGEIARRLSLKTHDEIQLLQKAINDLYKEEKIVRVRRKRYSLSPTEPTHKFIGTISITNQNYGIVHLHPPHEGTVTVQTRFMGTSLDGDVVRIAIFAHPSKLKDVKNIKQFELQGEVIEIIKRSERPIVGIFQKSKNFFFVVPDDNRIGRDIYIPKGKTKGARPGEKVIAVIEQWQSRHLNPEGKITEVIGKSGEVSAEMNSVIYQYRLPLQFPKDVIAEAEKIEETIPKSEIKKRLDLRQILCITIDPEDAKDFDDAVSLETLPGNNYLLGVHIADVSYYVKEGSKLDREALARGTSVYLANSVIPMLPEKLSNRVCSLVPSEDRLTYSIFLTISPRGAVKEYKLFKSIINNKRRFTYEEVQKIIETGHGPHSEMIKLMHKLSQILLKKRMREGSIDFESIETKFRFDENGAPAEIIKKFRLDSHRIIEEFMLLANRVVAQHIGKNQKGDHQKPFIYRVHDKPDPGKLRDLATFVEHLGYSLNLNNGVTPRAIQRLLNEVKNKDEENVVNEVAIRAMAKAVYSEKNIGHFGLGFRYYTHFTSPIRRYPDLVVHRLLYEYEQKLSKQRQKHLITVLPEICRQSSERERIAMEAERASIKVMQVEYMKRHLGDEFHAIISGVTNFGLFVEISDLLVEGLVRVRDMEDDYYVLDEKQYALIGKYKKKRYRLGDKVNVKVVRVDPEEREIDFILV